ncbi:putative F-box protein At3g22710 [Eutrema salsugineum]|uniref:putative F-box protein At3g22710 n=1 Tax=Eutrema salsugineum TaxID=72664 RepID=UPI000CECEB4B|nr:putative F-box protein At3g22710 [Eutrema salsugineum]
MTIRRMIYNIATEFLPWKITIIMSDLSLDLVEEILSRVPTASLTRLRATCKRWNALFKDRRFIEKHSRKAAKQPMAFMLKNSTIFLDDGLLIWNPCLGETRWIQPKINRKRWSRFSLGYDNNEVWNSYKILRSYEQDYKVVGSEIYEFSSDSWRALDVGNTYWLAFNSKYKFILSFDFTRERFRRFCLPTFQNLGGMALSVVREEKLSLLHRSFDPSSKMDMWVTNNNIDTETVLWSKSFTVDISTTDGYFHIPKSFLIDEEKKVVMCCNASFEPNSGKTEYAIHKYHTESLFVETTHVSEFPFNFSYVPSLVQIQ